MTETTKTPEQLAADAAATAKATADQKAAEKAQAKATKDAEKAAAKADKDAKAAEAKAAKETAALKAKADKEAEVKAKADAAAAAKAAKESSKMPEQNGVRRPKPEGACGKVWAMADSLSAQLGQPVPIANLSKDASAAGINDSTIRTQYALWRKFHGITGRVSLPVAAPVTPEAGAAAPAA